MNAFLRSHCLHALSIFICLISSATISSHCRQDIEEPAPRCIEIGPFESHIQASLQSRILQLQSQVELADAQTKRLRVVANGILRKEANRRDGTFYFGNPLHSKFWKSNVERILNDEQLAQRAEFDQATLANRQAAKAQYDVTPNEPQTKANFVAANLQFHLYLTNEQTDQIQLLLESHLEQIGDRNWDPLLTAFYESNQEKLETILSESQRLFFDGKSLINGIGDRAVWDTEWRKATCTDCHVM